MDDKTRAYARERRREAGKLEIKRDSIIAVLGYALGLLVPKAVTNVHPALFAILPAVLAVILFEVGAYVIRYIWVAPRSMYFDNLRLIAKIERDRNDAIEMLQEARQPKIQIFRHKEARKHNDAVFHTIHDHFQKFGWQVEGCSTDLPQHENGIRIAGKAGYLREMAGWGLKALGVEWIPDERPDPPDELQIIVGRYQMQPPHGEPNEGIDLQVSEMKFSWAPNAELPEGVLVVLDVERLVNRNTEDAVVDVKLVVPLWRPGSVTISTSARPLLMRPEQIRGRLPQFQPLVNLKRKQGIGPGFYAFFFGYDSHTKDTFLPEKQRAETLEGFAKKICEAEIMIEVTDRANPGYQASIPAPGTLQKRVDRMAREKAAATKSEETP